MSYPTSLPTLTPANLTSLKNSSNILHLFAHRNHNQHRRSPWYRHFDSFRRQLAKLITELSLCDNGAPSSKPSHVLAKTLPPSMTASKTTTKEATLKAVEAASKRRKRAEEARIRAERRVVFWRERLVWKWWGAFEMVVGDVQFAPLGVVLLACLGEVCGVLGVTVGLGKGRVEEGIEVEQDEKGDGVVRVDGGEKEYVDATLGEDGVDVGVRVERGHDEDGDLVEEKDAYASTAPKRQKREFKHEKNQGRKRPLPEQPDAFEKSTPVARNKRRKKPADAIDELFSGLA